MLQKPKDQCINQEVNLKNLETNYNEDTITQNVLDSAKAVLRRNS